jgi:hypothetical protein
MSQNGNAKNQEGKSGKTVKSGQGKGPGKGPGKEPGTAPSASKARIDDPINQGQKSKLTNVNKNMAPHNSQGGRRPCQYFAAGHCRKGNDCLFSHAPGTKQKSTSGPLTESSGPSSLNNEIKLFIKNLDNTKQAASADFLKKWLFCFSPDCGTLSKEQEYLLLRKYLQFPDQNSYAPPAEHVLLLLQRFLAGSRTVSEVETVNEIIKDRLLRTSSMQTITNKMPILNAIEALHESLLKASDNMDRSTKVESAALRTVRAQARKTFDMYSEMVEKVELSAPRDSNQVPANYAALPWSQNPTVGWLASGDIMNGLSPLTKKHENKDEYIGAMRSLWTMLTFYWGTAALWPKCTCEGMYCGFKMNFIRRRL